MNLLISLLWRVLHAFLVTLRGPTLPLCGLKFGTPRKLPGPSAWSTTASSFSGGMPPSDVLPCIRAWPFADVVGAGVTRPTSAASLIAAIAALNASELTLLRTTAHSPFVAKGVLKLTPPFRAHRTGLPVPTFLDVLTAEVPMGLMMQHASILNTDLIAPGTLAVLRKL